MIVAFAGPAPADTFAPTTTANPPGGLIDSPVSVVLSVDEAATTYYTTDGSNPTTSSSVYSAPIPISADTTLKFFSKDAAGNSELFKVEDYLLVAFSSEVSSIAFEMAANNITFTMAEA